MDFAQITSTIETLRLTPPSQLTLLDGHIFSPLHYPPTPPDVDTLILNIDSQELALQIKKVLSAVYPADHKIFLVQNEKKEERVDNLGNHFSSTFNLYIPSLGAGTSFESFAEIVAHLR